MSELIIALKKGGRGNKRGPDFEPTGLPPIHLEDRSTPNDLKVHFIKHGREEQFPANSLVIPCTVLAKPRYFSFDQKGRVALNVQHQLVRCTTGEDKKGLDDETAQRRSSTWRKWFDGADGDAVQSFETSDLPDIARQFTFCWDNAKGMTRNDSIGAATLKSIHGKFEKF
jgi:hypothetical protein